MEALKLAYIITEPCIGTKDTACVDVCPVDCIHPRKDEPEFATTEMLYIHPDECIDCGACVPACPVEAIFALDETPDKWQNFIETNAQYTRSDGRLASTRESKAPSRLRSPPILRSLSLALHVCPPSEAIKSQFWKTNDVPQWTKRERRRLRQLRAAFALFPRKSLPRRNASSL